MTAVTHPEFNEKTEGLEVAKAFPEAIRGKTILVTGVNRGGIGFTIAQAFASQAPSNLIIAGRNLAKIQECINALKTEYPEVTCRALKLDLSSQKAVRAAAEVVLSWSDVPVIDTAVNNAAVMNLPERTLSEDGIEMHFATNHIGHFLFTCLIIPKLINAAEHNQKGATRVVNVTSLSPTLASMRWSDINFDKSNKDLPPVEQPSYEMHKWWGVVNPEEKSYVPIEGYNQSKVANVLFGIALNRRLYDKYGILSLATHPGVIVTELSRYAAPETIAAIQERLKSGQIYVKSLGAGASTSLVAAVDAGLGLPLSKNGGKENHGAYLIDCQISDKALPGATSNAEAEKLWELSEELVKERFDW